MSIIDGIGTSPDPSYDGFLYEELQGYDGPLAVTCPLIRDRINSTGSLKRAYVEGRNVSNANGGAFECTLYSQTEDLGGSVLDFHTRSTASTGLVQLGPFSVATTSGNEGAYSMYCYLNPSDEIFHVFVEEDSGASD